KLLHAFTGVSKSAERVIGFAWVAVPVVGVLFGKGCTAMSSLGCGLSNYGSAVAVMSGAIFGAIFFFLYCQWRWGRWDMYMPTQSAGWTIEPDYLPVFRPSNSCWLMPQLNDPTQLSKMSMTAGAFLSIAI